MPRSYSTRPSHDPNARILEQAVCARAPEEVAGLPGVTWVVGNSHKHQVAGDCDWWQRLCVLRHACSFRSSIHSRRRHFRAHGADCGTGFNSDDILIQNAPNLKVQDGCIIAARSALSPRPRTKSLHEAGARARRANALVGRWVSQIVLSASLGCGRDIAPQSRFDIFSARCLSKRRLKTSHQLSGAHGLERELIELSQFARSQACAPSLQSGSDRILRHDRKFAMALRRENSERSRSYAGCGNWGDVMVVFPVKTEELFERTAALLKFTVHLLCMFYLLFGGRGRRPRPCRTSTGQDARERNRILRELAARKKTWNSPKVCRQDISPGITLQDGDAESTEA